VVDAKARRVLSAVALGIGLGLSAVAPGRAQTPMPTGGAAVPPGGFLFFCAKHLSECSGVTAPRVVDLSSARRNELATVQVRVNLAIRYRDDPAHAWDYPDSGYGDCPKYALEKQRELVELGWPRQALLLAVAFTERGDPHLVLVVRTDEGDLVLDNRVTAVVAWTDLPYRWVARQSPINPALWVAIEPSWRATADAGEPRSTP